MEIAYSLASEELHPTDMVHAARRAEEFGFQSVWLSDHFHPWTDRQGQSPFVWSVIGGIAATTRLRVGTAVTCPLIRMHPALPWQEKRPWGAVAEPWLRGWPVRASPAWSMKRRWRP